MARTVELVEQVFSLSLKKMGYMSKNILPFYLPFPSCFYMGPGGGRMTNFGD